MPTTERRLAQLTLLSKLGQALNSATSLHSLCALTSQLLLEHNDVVGVVIRPRLYGSPPPKPCYSTFDSSDPALQIFLLQQDSQLSSQVLHQGQNKLQHPLSEQRRESFPVSIYALPLRIHDRNFGTLSLFGGNPNGTILSTRNICNFFKPVHFRFPRPLSSWSPWLACARSRHPISDGCRTCHCSTALLSCCTALCPQTNCFT